MSDVLLTKRIEFSASHRYHNPEWSDEQNREVFGACNNASGHGHNYLLEVTVGGPVDPATGMVVNLYDLKEVLKQVLIEFDHKHLNLDTPYFQRRIPTSENLAGVLWTALKRRPEIGRLDRVRLFEDEDLAAEVTAADFDPNGDLRRATLVRRYHFSAVHDAAGSSGPCRQAGAHGHDYALEVAVDGTIDAATGMVTDLTGLDRTVRSVLRDVAGRVAPAPAGEQVVRWLWERLKRGISPGRLARLRLTESRDTYYEAVRQ